MKLVEVTPQTVDSLYLALRGERGLSGSTVRRYHAVLSSIFRLAANYDLVLRNPMDRVRTPKPNESERRSLSEAEASRLLACIAEAEARAYRAEDEKEARELRKIGVAADGNTPIMCNAAGSFVHPNNFSRWWREFHEEYGFEGLKMHELRHTWATLALANGTDVKTVQTRLGHADGSLTLNWYAHATPENDRAAADLMGRILGGETPRSTARLIKREELRSA